MTTYAYDQAGNLISAIDAKGQQTSFAYDGLNRRIRQSIAGGADIVASYDSGPGAIGRISGITDGEGTASFVYDQSGRLALESRVTAGRQHSIAYTWDNSSGELLAMTYPSGLTLSLTRDAAGRVTDMRLGNEVLLSAATYLPFGPLKTATLGSVNLTRHYDQRYNLAMIEGGGLRHQYTRNALGNVIALADLATPPVDDAATEYTYNTANNQLTATAGTKAVAYSYDANGNLVSAGGRVFVYDGLNRLIKVEDQGTVVATYGYDSSNRRIRKTVGSTTTCYLYDINSQLIAESVDGTVAREYFYLDGQPLALREYQSNPGTYFFINDHLGTPQRLVSGSGTLVWQAIYSPFGKAERVTGSVQNNLRFPGQYFDAETGLHYNWHRYYDPDAGRYVSADPIGLDGGMNLYAYVKNDPVNWVDPLGLFGDGGPNSTFPGHDDFIGSDRLDYTKEDHGWSNPLIPFSTWRHFRDLEEIERDLDYAIYRCNKEWVERYMHQGQDYFSHYDRGYRRWFGHAFDGHAPDHNLGAWRTANKWTRKWLKK